MSVTAALSGALFVITRLTILAKAKEMATLEWSVLCLASLAIVNVTAHSYLAHDPSQFVYLLMFAFGISLVGPSKRVVASVFIMIFIVATFLTMTGPASAIINNVFTTMTAISVGFAGGAFLHKTIRAQRAAAALAKDLLGEVEKEGARNKILAEDANIANHAKADFLANMSHELRTPLNGVVGIANALASSELTPRQREMVELIEKSGQTLTRLLTDILDFSKIEAGKIDIERAPFNLREEIDSAAFLMQSRAAEKSLSFDVSYSDAANGWIEGDGTRIKQIVTNLTSNAIKFTQTGGVYVAIDWSAESEILEIKVTDTGVGFDVEAGKRLFQRFVQADASITRRFGGTGLGLAICRGLVDAMSGGLSWSSQPGIGSVFTVRLPAPPAQAPLPREQSLPQTCEDGDTQTIKILAAEDHETNQKVLSMILEPLGIDLVICENGALAVEAYQTQAFDIVLMDMQMPVMDGLAATRAIRALESQSGAARTPIIMLTANAMRQHREAAKEAGADWHVAKPFTPASLLEAIEIALSCELDGDEVTHSDVA
jgi:signal transduction histidine kinase/CheY-like chemotaxis protein